MTTFYPGPSKVYPQVAQYLQDAYQSGLLSMNHRSQAFMDMLQETLRLMRLKLAIPTDYLIYFISSATEAWEIIAQSLTAEQSTHYYNGAFGKKWHDYASKIVPQTVGIAFDINQPIIQTISHAQNLINTEVLCLTHNETSNGTQLIMSELSEIRKSTEALIAIDATSSLGGVKLDWTLGDVWFASIQKCLGLPAGMGIMVCSPKALQKAQVIGDTARYNSLIFIHENFQKFQTHYTPNTLAIYLLMRVMEQVQPIDNVHDRLKIQAKDWYEFLEKQTQWQMLVTNPATRSDTVIAVQGEATQIAQFKKATAAAGIIIGNGYGDWKNTTFRIANFPAIDEEEIEKLKEILE